MADSEDNGSRRNRTRTRLTHLGRDPARHYGFVNTPVYRGSTVLFPTVDSLEERDQPYVYGRRGTPTIRALETAISELEGGEHTVLTPSGLNAISCVYLTFLKAGDHLLLTDSVYQPARRLADGLLQRLGIETTYYDPLAGGAIADLIRDNTRLVYVEAPGSQTFEIQDIPAIAAAAHAAGALVVADNTWATPLYCNPLRLGADIVLHAGTKYFGGHADANLGSITVGAALAAQLRGIYGDMGVCPGSEDVFLCLRGLRTLAVRLEQHRTAAIEMAEWLRERPEVARVIHPALEDHPGHAIWKRDFTGSSGLFAAVLQPTSRAAVTAMLDDLELFGMGWSWGGFESLAVPFDPAGYRTATVWDAEGPALRFHIGLEDTEDLKEDLEKGFQRLREAA